MYYKLLSLIFGTLLFLSLNKAHAEPFKVGVILPLSGPAAEFGEAIKNGVDLFRADYSNQNIAFFFEDSKYDGPAAISAFNKLMESDKVDLVYSWGSIASAVVAPIAEFKKFPVVLLTGAHDITKNKKFSIDFVDKLEEYSKVELEELRRRGYKKFGVVKTEIQYLETLVKGIKDNLRKDESLEIIESFQPGAQINFQSTLTKLKINLKKNKYDAVGVFLMNGQLSSFYRKMHDQKIVLPTFGPDFFDSIIERREAGPSIIGGIWTTVGITEKFENTYKNRYNKKDQIGFAAGFYDLATLINDLFSEDYKNNKKLTPEEILSRIESAKERDGVSGKYYFTRDNPEGDPVGGKRFKFPIVIKEVTEGGGERVIK